MHDAFSTMRPLVWIAADERQASLWSQLLATDGQLDVAGLDQAAAGEPLAQVLLFPATAAGGAQRPWPPLPERQRGRIEQAIRRGELALVAIGGASSSLELDRPPLRATLTVGEAAGQLRLACRLLAQLVAERRQGARLAAAHEQLASLAHRDPLTGLANRRAWEAELGERFAAASRDGRSLSLAIFDLDHFKTVNDRYGHATGDRVLAAAGAALARAVRACDLAARLGGDELAVALAGVAEAAAPTVVERIRRQLVAALLDVAPQPVRASAGYCAVAPADGSPSTRLAALAAADRALYEAKHSGRDRTSGPPLATGPPPAQPPKA